MKTILKTIAALMGLTGVMAGAVQAETIFSVTQISYDIRNQPVCTAVRMNPSVYGSLPSDACVLGTQSGVNGPDRITKNVYDSAGQLTEVIRAYNITTANGFPETLQQSYARYTYTANGLKATEKDANGNLTTLEYDGFDRLSKLRYPSTTVGSGTSSTTDYEDYGYDANGNKTYWRRRDGQVINDCFDNLNRVIIHYVHAQSGCTATGGTKDVYTTYNGSGQIVSKRFASFSGSGVTYAYDGLGRLSSTTDMNSRTLSYQYTAAGSRTRLTFPDGNYIGSDIDNAGRLKTMGWGANSGLYSRTYNNLGQLVTETKGGGSVSYAYDGIGRLSTFTNNLNGTANDITWTFGYNPASQIVSNDPSSTLYDYEELTAITEPAQSHDGLNRISTLVGVTGACPLGGYDARGNLICDGTGRSYDYDIENRLLSGNIAGNALALTYDPEGRLASYSWNGGVVSFLYDGVNLIGEYNSSSQMLRRYVHGPGTDNPVAWHEGSGNSTLRYFYTNQQGSVITTTDAAGNRGDIYAYGAYGEPKDQYGFTYWPSIGTGSTSVSRFGYTGQMFLADARLYYYKARIYDPQMGRFLQTDPIGSDDDLNLYAYVGGDPVNGADPTGMVECAVGCFFGEGVGTGNAEASHAESVAGFAKGAVAELARMNVGAAQLVGDPLGLTEKYADWQLGMAEEYLAPSGSEEISAAKLGAGAVFAASLLLPGPKGVRAGQGGRFAELAGPVGDNLAAHHMPQAALKFTSRADGGAIVMTHAEHALTRTFAGKGVRTAINDAQQSFRSTLAKDFKDVRSIVGRAYNQGLRDVSAYYKKAYPQLMRK